MWSLDWLTRHCQRRFGVTPQPRLLADKWGVSAAALAASGASKIVFTNGLNDGWSAGGITEDLSPTLLSVNMPQGAHHLDLRAPNAADPAQVTETREREEILPHIFSKTAPNGDPLPGSTHRDSRPNVDTRSPCCQRPQI